MNRALENVDTLSNMYLVYGKRAHYMCRVLISLTLTKEILSVLLGLIIRKSCNCKTEVCACC